MSGSGIGYGKTILFGEHFVVYGLPGIASAIGDHTIAEVEQGEEGLHFIDNRPAVEGYKHTKREEISRQLDAIFNFMKIDLKRTPLKITLSGNLECDDDQINDIAFEGERAGAGTPSGIDNTCSTYGGMITFEKNLSGGPNKIEMIRIAKPLEIVTVSTGITQETKEVVAAVRSEKEKDPAKFERIFNDYKDLFNEATAALKEGNVQTIGMLMDRNQDLLREITVSCPEAEEIISIAKSSGALGAKLTGTGRGGLVICLAPDSHTAEKIAHATQHAGFKTSITTVG
jgi:mevalonate kinase